MEERIISPTNASSRELKPGSDDRPRQTLACPQVNFCAKMVA